MGSFITLCRLDKEYRDFIHDVRLHMDFEMIARWKYHPFIVDNDNWLQDDVNEVRKHRYNRRLDI